MERQAVIRDLSAEIETLARLHIQHGLHHTKGFANQKRNIEKLIQDNEVNLKKELDPLVLNLYRRYFGSDKRTRQPPLPGFRHACGCIRKRSEKRRQSATSLKVQTALKPVISAYTTRCTLVLPAQRSGYNAAGGPQVNFACSYRLRCRFHRWVTPISAIIYTTTAWVCQELFVRIIYFCLFKK
jgi:hypothetical protein